jgi:hypothetical protein
MANGFPKPGGEPPLSLRAAHPPKLEADVLPQPAAHPSHVANGARAFSGSASQSSRLGRQSPLRSRPLLCALALLGLSGAGAGLASHTFGTQATGVEPRARVPAVTATEPMRTPVRVLPTLPVGSGAPDSESEANIYRGVGPGVPEAYTGDPAGQALWDKTVEEDQQTIQPDDLVEEPPPPKLDYSKIPAYQALKIDADGNVNE